MLDKKNKQFVYKSGWGLLLMSATCETVSNLFTGDGFVVVVVAKKLNALNVLVMYK